MSSDPTAKGFIHSVPGSPNRFAAAFMVNKLHYGFFGNMGSGVPEFACNNAKLTYDDPGDLTTTRFFWGTVGTDDISITLENGPTITGRLNMPVDPSSSLAGTGVWSAN
jgi:hypothetical protein